MRLKDWAFLGNYEFFTNKLQVLATNELIYLYGRANSLL